MKQNKIILKCVAVLLAILVWQVAANAIQLPILLVGPLDVLKRLGTIWKEPLFFPSIWFSFYHIVLGFFLATVIGFLLGLLAGKSSILETLLWPYMACIKSVPVASIVVICLIWLSAKNLSVFIAFLIVLPMVYQNTLTGYRSQDRKMKELMKVYGIRGFKGFWHVTLPAMKAYLLAGIQVGAGMAWKAGVAAEVIGNPNGSIGQQIYLSKIYLDTDDLLAWTLALVIISIVFEKLVTLLVKKLLP